MSEPHSEWSIKTNKRHNALTLECVDAVRAVHKGAMGQTLSRVAAAHTEWLVLSPDVAEVRVSLAGVLQAEGGLQEGPTGTACVASRGGQGGQSRTAWPGAREVWRLAQVSWLCH